MTESQNAILKKAETILTPREFEFSQALLEELYAINLDDNSVALACLCSINDLNDEKKKLISDTFSPEALKSLELFKRIGGISMPRGDKRIQTLRKIFIELSEDLKIIILKLYERLIQLRFAFNEKSEHLEALADECLNLYSPIAHRLGIRQIYNQMEDISFKALYPEDFHKIHKAIEKKKEVLQSKLKYMSDLLKEQMKNYKIDCDIQFRLKRPYSIYKKLINQNIELDQIYDLMALRVITDKVENCYLALGIVHRNWIPIEKRFRDWVTFPKPNGYRSIQTTVITKVGDKFEIQIRTKDMHREAEYGSAAHWAYKEKVNTDEDWISRLKEFLENDEYFNNPEALEDLLKSEAKRNFIHILTPKGEVKTIPEGSTVLDFAFTVHTEVFFHCTGARINNKFAKLKTELKTGDIVEILTNKNAKPSRDWLSAIKSHGAKSKLVQWLKKNESDQLEFEGKRIWDRYKKLNKHKLIDIDEESAFKHNLIKTGYKSQEDFFAALGSNSLRPSSTLLRKLFPNAFVKKEQNKETKEKSKNTAEDIQVIVEGLSNIETKLAKCCNPIKGEPIVAYITQKTGIKVHSVNCPYFLAGNLDEERLKPATWADDAKLQTVKMRILGADYAQMLSSAIEFAQSLKIQVLSTEMINYGAEMQCLDMSVLVKDIDHYQALVKKLKTRNFIKSVK
jgi:GTP pyrophosphokinase